MTHFLRENLKVSLTDGQANSKRSQTDRGTKWPLFQNDQTTFHMFRFNPLLDFDSQRITWAGFKWRVPVPWLWVDIWLLKSNNLTIYGRKSLKAGSKMLIREEEMKVSRCQNGRNLWIITSVFHQKILFPTNLPSKWTCQYLLLHTYSNQFK